MKSHNFFTLSMTVACIVVNVGVYADVDLSSVVEVIRQTPANNDFVLPSDSRFERKWQNFTKAVNDDIRHNIGDAFVLIDTTVFGACDEGILIDRLGITVQHDFSDNNGFISWTDFALNGIVSRENDNLILYEKPKIVAHFAGSNFKVANACLLFDRLLAAIRNRQNNANISSPVASTQQQNQSSQVNIQDLIFNKRIEKFGGFYLGAEIRLPECCKNFGLPGYEDLFADWVEESECLKGAKYIYDKKEGMIIQQDMPLENVYRFVWVTPRTRLVGAVQLCYYAPSSRFVSQKQQIEDFFRKEFSNSIGLPVFMNDGNIIVDKGSQLVNFENKDVMYNGNSFSGVSVMVIDLRSYQTEVAEVNAQNAREQALLKAAEQARITGDTEKVTSNSPQLSRAQALLAKDKAKKQAAAESRQKGLDSFCGIEFGTVVNCEMYRTDGGKYLTCVVRLKTPFRGHETARVYASVKSRRIFRVDIEGFRFDLWEGGPVRDAVSKRYGFQPQEIENPFQRLIDSYEWRFSNALIRFYFDYSNVRSGKLYMPSSESGILSATSLSWEHFADDEFKKESGGDGSSVL